jgi:hypothetical protein
MDWLESGVFCGIRADEGARTNNKILGIMFSVQSVP